MSQQKTILDKLIIIRELAIQKHISYPELLQIITTNRFSLKKILFWLMKKYSFDEYDKIKANWHKYLQNQEIKTDANSIICFQVERQWQSQGILNYNKIKKIEQKYLSKLQGNLKSKQAIFYRMKQLRAQLSQCQGRLQNQNQQSVRLIQQQKFLQLKQQFRYWKERKRKIRQEKIHQEAIKELESYTKNLTISTKIKSILMQKINQNKNMQNQKMSQIFFQNKMNSDQIKKNIQSIFKFYSKLRIGKISLFSDVEERKNIMHFENYIQFIRDFNLSKQISLNCSIDLFKKKTHYVKRIQLNDFIELLKDIFRINCQNKKKQFTLEGFNKFIERDILCSENINKYILKRNRPLSKDKLSEYKFMLKPHSGKLETEIEEKLSINKQKRIKKNHQSLKVTRNRKGTNQQKTTNRTYQTEKNRPQRQSKNLSAVSLQKSQFPKYQQKYNSHSYAKKYQRMVLQKNQNKNLIQSKIQIQKQNLKEQNTTKQENLQQIIGKDNLNDCQEIQELIDAEEEDEFLTQNFSPKVKLYKSRKFHF